MVSRNGSRKIESPAAGRQRTRAREIEIQREVGVVGARANNRNRQRGMFVTSANRHV